MSVIQTERLNSESQKKKALGSCQPLGLILENANRAGVVLQEAELALGLGKTARKPLLLTTNYEFASVFSCFLK